MFQFHKVRLKDGKTKKFQCSSLFQFHKVRLKGMRWYGFAQYVYVSIP